MKDQEKSIRFTKEEIEIISKVADIERRTVSDLIRVKSIEKIIEEQKKVLDEMIQEKGLNSKDVLEQSKLIDLLLNKL